MIVTAGWRAPLRVDHANTPALGPKTLREVTHVHGLAAERRRIIAEQYNILLGAWPPARSWRREERHPVLNGPSVCGSKGRHSREKPRTVPTSIISMPAMLTFGHYGDVGRGRGTGRPSGRS